MHPPSDPPIRSASAFQWLKLVLLFSGAILLLAAVAVMLPVAWMQSAHRWLGLGEFPNLPITVYLARSTSLLYAVHGALMTYTGLTLKWHWRFVPCLGWLHVIIGLVLLGIDLSAPMPGWWTAIEGPSVAAAGGLVLFLNHRTFGAPSVPKHGEQSG